MKLSRKQRQVLSWWRSSKYSAIICDGAVRSGKTFAMSLSFVIWAFASFDGESFALCSKTKIALMRNVIYPLIKTLAGFGIDVELFKTDGFMDIAIAGRRNRFYFFGGRDESSAGLIQGITLAGILFDEVALNPRSFVEQGLARCSVSGARFWFNCNPDHPYHWFYREWILKAEKKNALYLHFKMGDNPSLSPKVLQRYERLYEGVFYRRFILGEWVAQAGLVFAGFDRERHVLKALPESFEKYYISCDYGTVNPCSMGLWGLSASKWYRLGESYFDGRKEGVFKTDDEHLGALLVLAGERKIEAIIIDPSAASFIELIRKDGRFKVLKAKNDVKAGISAVNRALKDGDILFADCCEDSIREFSLYRYDEGGISDSPIKKDDHAMDDIRYFVYTIMEKENSGRGFFAFAQDR